MIPRSKQFAASVGSPRSPCPLSSDIPVPILWCGRCLRSGARLARTISSSEQGAIFGGKFESSFKRRDESKMNAFHGRAHKPASDAYFCAQSYSANADGSGGDNQHQSLRARWPNKTPCTFGSFIS